MEYDSTVGAYVETHTTPVANHKGLSEIEKNARRECNKLQRKNPQAQLAQLAELAPPPPPPPKGGA